jgi:triosephosphate isomerase
MRPLIAGNWKMNLGKAEALDLVRTLGMRYAQTDDPWFDMLVCPPATLIDAVVQALAGSGVAIGGQDCHTADSGAHTGDIAAPMLADLGCSHVIVGHSERRQNHGEIDLLIAEKAQAGHRSRLVTIICIGETEAERDEGKAQAVVSRQLAGSVPDTATAANTVIAYEPVWAIGTGRTASAADVAEMHGHIRAQLSTRVPGGSHIPILYGGSVKPDNAEELLAVDHVNGALVGGASLKADSFWGIAEQSPSQA